MIDIIKNKAKIGLVIFMAFFFSATLIKYVFPTKSATINKNFAQDMQKDFKGFLAGIFDSKTREMNSQMNKLKDLAKNGTFKTIDKGIQVAEDVNGAVFKTSVNAMDWQEYKTYTINGKTIKVRVEKGQPDPSQELLEKLAQYYQ